MPALKDQKESLFWPRMRTDTEVMVYNFEACSELNRK